MSEAGSKHTESYAEEAALGMEMTGSRAPYLCSDTTGTASCRAPLPLRPGLRALSWEDSGGQKARRKLGSGR